MIHKSLFLRHEKPKIKSPSYFTEGTEAALIQGLYDGTSLSELMAPMLKRIVEAALSGEGVFRKLCQQRLLGFGDMIHKSLFLRHEKT